jgi:hypothetical protein
MPLWMYIPPFCIFYIFYMIIKKSISHSTIKFTMVETDILQIRIRGDFRRNNASDIEVFTDGRQNDVDLANVSLTWHMKVHSDFSFCVYEYYNGDDDMTGGDLSLARKITIKFDEDYRKFQLSYQTYEELIPIEHLHRTSV